MIEDRYYNYKIENNHFPIFSSVVHLLAPPSTIIFPCNKKKMEDMGRNGVAAVLPPPSHQRNPATVFALRQGIWNILSKWNALQMAVENKWGGTDSLDKSHQLASGIESWFSKSKGTIFIFKMKQYHVHAHKCCVITVNLFLEEMCTSHLICNRFSLQLHGVCYSS